MLVFAGRLGPQKALGVAVEGARRRAPTSTLVVAGDGPERAALERESRELGLDGRVSFLGAFRASACCGCSAPPTRPCSRRRGRTSRTRSSRRSRWAAPVIATAVGGVPEVVKDGENGLLVRRGDPTALAEAIARFFADDELRAKLAAAAPGSVEGHSEEAVFATIEAELQGATA